MAAYMRKTGILPVCTNNEARAYFAGKGITYADVTEGDILALPAASSATPSTWSASTSSATWMMATRTSRSRSSQATRP